MLLSFPEIVRLLGDRAHFLNYLDYDEEDGTRNYCLDLRSMGATDEAWYRVRIGLIERLCQSEVEVSVQAGHRADEEIGRFRLDTRRFGSPLSIDPEAMRLAMDIVVADRK